MTRFCATVKGAFKSRDSVVKTKGELKSVAEVQSRTNGSDQTGRTELTVQFRFWFLFGLGLSVLVHGSGE